MIFHNKYFYRGVIFILLFFICFSAPADDNSSDLTGIEVNVQYLKTLIARLSASPFIDSFAPELEEGEELFKRAMALLASEEMESARMALQESEIILRRLLEREQQYNLEAGRERALGQILAAGKALEEASFAFFINERGEPEEGFSYKFSLEKRAAYSVSLENGHELSYKDAIVRAAIYLEQAKEAYNAHNYEHAFNYAEVTARVAALFKDSGIKEIYRVKRGDCLWTIAEKSEVYGSSFYWPLLYRANKGLIVDPDTIEPGDELIIPHFD